jgi:putative FmdB family regulatory protein
MPLYEYQCDACGHRFEHIQKFSDPPVEECPVCGARAVKKLVSSPAIQFKGTGWYVTDYARKGDGRETKDAKESKESKDSKGATETKDATSSGGKESGAGESKSASDAASATSSSSAPAKSSSKGSSTKND